MKKIVSSLLALSLVVAGTAGCKQNKEADKSIDENAKQATVSVNKEGYPITNEKLMLKMFAAKSPLHGEWSEMQLFKELEEKTNIGFDFILVPQSSVEEKKNLLIASNDLPDLFFSTGFTTAQEMKYASEKKLAPIDSYINDGYAPNLKKILDSDENIKQGLSAPDGHIYGLTALDLYPGRANFPMYFINQKWLTKLGLELPETPDEFYNVLKAFREKDPNGNGLKDEIPLTLAGMWQFTWMLPLFDIVCDDYGIYEEDNVVKYAFTDDRFKESLKFFNKLYKEKLLDNDSMTQKNAQIYAKGKEKDTILGCFTSSAPFMVVGQEKNDDYCFLEPMTTMNDTKKWLRWDSVKNKSNFAITTVNKSPEATMRWIDFFYSEGASAYINDGVEGVNYKKNANGKYEHILLDGYGSFEEQKGKLMSPTAGGDIPFASYPSKNDWEKQWDGNETLIWMNDQVEKIYAPVGKIAIPRLHFDEEQSNRITAIKADLKTYVENMRARFITGELDIDKTWDEYLETLEKMHVNELVEIHQDALDKRLAN